MDIPNSEVPEWGNRWHFMTYPNYRGDRLSPSRSSSGYNNQQFSRRIPWGCDLMARSLPSIAKRREHQQLTRHESKTVALHSPLF